MRVVFLDIDGVLNWRDSTSRYHGFLGIDDDKVERLARIVKATNAKIVLVSTWKADWDKTDFIEDLPSLGQYMVKKLKNFGLSIFDKTIDDWEYRGKGIKNWIAQSKIPIESIVILDDEWFDYASENLHNYVIKTNFYDEPGGLQDAQVSEAIKILEGSYEEKCNIWL